jgi:hypothetical protein
LISKKSSPLKISCIISSENFNKIDINQGYTQIILICGLINLKNHNKEYTFIFVIKLPFQWYKKLQLNICYINEIWTYQFRNVEVHYFTERTGAVFPDGFNVETASPKDYFDLMFNPDMIGNIVRNTNNCLHLIPLQKTLQNRYRRHQIENIYLVLDRLLAMPPCLFTISTTRYFPFTSPKDYFDLMFNPDMIGNIVRNTNNYARWKRRRGSIIV